MHVNIFLSQTLNITGVYLVYIFGVSLQYGAELTYEVFHINGLCYVALHACFKSGLFFFLLILFRLQEHRNMPKTASNKLFSFGQFF